MSQADQILAHLQEHGVINPLEALNLYGCFRLAARIAELRETHDIASEPFRTPGGATVSRYTLAGKEEQTCLPI